MGLLERFRRRDREAAAPLYAAVVAKAREPHWYLDGGVPDTLDGRFDMVAAVLAMVMLRIEAEPPGDMAAATLATDVTERFVDDMDAQVRQIGFGDIVVGKHVGRMMGMLGGRLGAYRTAIATGDLSEPLIRNLWRGNAPAAEASSYVSAQLQRFHASLQDVSLADLREGRLA
ncbi:ubiquinol-cytochrome C chaperone [Sphingomonas sp. IC-11]|uniref:ubiquinol-cytochrome C chaperone family protein n=1 Tax=Sphingomonas sp. IC-11 TaxID=2898528 RepID=UPI001E54FB87|nr:ubiquinol-cytochrome C chaperone family protein [Sphingomonas sp. IC-11]MCD2316399.1 ubiquinol-cytochrome C chaperone [Sphingomonas sp. IC-11]